MNKVLMAVYVHNVDNTVKKKDNTCIRSMSARSRGEMNRKSPQSEDMLWEANFRE